MTESDARQIQSGSLSAKIIRACPTHKTCPLTCRERRVEDLGELAHFDNRGDDPPLIQRLKEGLGKWLH